MDEGKKCLNYKVSANKKVWGEKKIYKKAGDRKSEYNKGGYGIRKSDGRELINRALESAFDGFF